MSIQTAKCKLCDTVVAVDFLSTHMRFVHPESAMNEVDKNEINKLNEKDNFIKKIEKQPQLEVALAKQTKKLNQTNSSSIPIKNKIDKKEINKFNKKDNPIKKNRKTTSVGSSTNQTTKLKQTNSSRTSLKRREKRGNFCILCGKLVPSGLMLEHKERVHGETNIPRKPLGISHGRVWVSIVQGGLPSLGKRSR